MTAWGREVLPYGVFTVDGDAPRVGVAIDDGVLPLDDSIFGAGSLDAFLAAGPDTWAAHRRQAQSLVASDPELVPASVVTTRMAWTVADYVDFYSSEQHATNVGRIFRPGTDPLPPHWKHLPIGYHGRSGTVVVSGTDITRPRGLVRTGEGQAPSYLPSTKLDVEVEVGFVVGVGSEPGSTVSTSAFADHVFGLVLVNDWSARDVQSYEYVPLGPMLGKSFATSVSDWVVPLAALQGARVPSPVQDPPPPAHLAVDSDWALDLQLELSVDGHVLSRPPFAGTWWTGPQQLAHLTSNGASLRTGDLFASGTVSGPEPDQWGSLLELTWDATRGDRGFLLDGEQVVIRGTTANGLPLGEVRGRVLPAR